MVLVEDRSPSITSLVDPEALFNDDDEDSSNVLELPLSPDVTEFGGSEDVEYFQELFSNEDDGVFEIKLFGAFEQYVGRYEQVMNKGLLVKELNVESKEGRAFVLEYGTGENEEWYIEKIEKMNIKKFSHQKVVRLLKSVTFNVEKGYTILLKQYQ